VVSYDLAGCDTCECTRGNVSLDVGFAAPGVLLFVYIDYVIVTVVVPITITIASILALVKVSLFLATAPIYLFHSTFIVVVFFMAGAGNLSIFMYLGALNELIGGFTFADDDGLGCFFSNNDWLHLHGCRRFISNINRLRLLLWLLRLAEIFDVSGVLLERILVLSWCKVALIVSVDADLAH